MEYHKINIKWSGARSISVSAGAATTSDVFLTDGNAVGLWGTFKANNATATPTAGDTVDVYLLGSVGDPDGSGTYEYPSADTTHGIFITTLDTLVTDPAIKSAALPAFEFNKLRIVNNAATTVTFSGVIRQRVE